DVAEAVLVQRAPIRRVVLYQPLRDEGLQVAAERAVGLRRQQFSQRLYSEVLADDGSPGQHAARPRAKALQTGTEQRLDRGRQHRPDLAPGQLAERGRQLLEVERIAGRRLEQVSPSGRRDALIPGQ